MAKLLGEHSALKDELKEMEASQALQVKKELLASNEKVGDARLFTLRGEIKPDIVRDIAYQLKGEVSEPFAFIGATTQGIRSQITILLSDQLVQKGLHAGNMVKSVAKLIRGGGGGQPFFATAGGKGSEGLEEATTQLVKAIETA